MSQEGGSNPPPGGKDMGTRKPAGRTRQRRSTQRRPKRGKAKTETAVGTRPGGDATWEGLDGSATTKETPMAKSKEEAAKPEPKPAVADAPEVEAPPEDAAVQPEPAPEPAPAEPEPASSQPEPAATTWDPDAWVRVSYTGEGLIQHPEAGLFVHGTTTMLRGRVAESFVGVEGFEVG